MARGQIGIGELNYRTTCRETIPPGASVLRIATLGGKRSRRIVVASRCADGLELEAVTYALAGVRSNGKTLGFSARLCCEVSAGLELDPAAPLDRVGGGGAVCVELDVVNKTADPLDAEIWLLTGALQ